MEETSLSDFVGVGESESAGEGTEASATAEESTADVTDQEAEILDGPTADPPAESSTAGESDRPAVTAAWVPEGGTCERCEDSVGWIWADGDRRVCRDCKDW